MTGWLIALGVLAALWLLGRVRLGVRAEYREGTASVRLRAGPLSLQVYPAPRREKKTRKKPEKTGEKKPARAAAPKHGLPPAGQLAELACQAAGALRRKIRVDELTAHITWADPDPARAAIGFGRANAALGMIWPLIDHNFHVKRRDLGVAVDFQGERPQYDLRAAVTMTLGQLLAFALRFGGKLWMTWSRGRKASGTRQEASV